MLENFKTVSEIINFFKEKLQQIETEPSAKLSLARLYHMAFSYQEKMTEEDKIKKLFDEKDTLLGIKNPVQNVTIVNDEIAIVETKEHWNNKRKTYFYAVVNGKKHFECAKTFDYALILAISLKYGEEKCAPKMIYNMLNMYKFELMDELK